MLEFRTILKQTGRIKFYYEFNEAIGIQKDNLTNIKNGTKDIHFTVKHIEKAVTHFGANPNFLFGLSDKIFREKA
ncbi:hypothetical protein GNY06_02980 [Elizabethkingia argentiflava]|uniref:XRE family transcriptional regulator n=1 Tax=Elizabethkingia argenteiflava TaxID=2681556 RepID=A0A845PV86_9FLAO|nr:hypothetical protein [Elizabethkingia argenteiflava]NAW50397.1 hypothetical protein [Elizabethkingia argenteiflava]